MKHSALLLLVAVITLQACKYDDGPGISFRSRKERATNFWRTVTVIDNGTDVTTNWLQSSTNPKGLEMLEDGTAKFYYANNFDPNFTILGTWNFIDDDEGIAITLNVPLVGPQTDAFEILRLKEDELWLRDNRDDADADTYILYKFETK